MALVFKVNSNLSAFTCTDAGFSVSDGSTGDSVSATVLSGSISGSVSPDTYQSGSNTYTATINVPSGYSNSGGTIVCTDTATGSGGGGSPSPDGDGGDPPAPSGDGGSPSGDGGDGGYDPGGSPDGGMGGDGGF